MEKSRTETLEEILQSRPEDAFARYGLALERVNSGGLEEAWKHLEYLLDHSPDYLPTYYQAGMILPRLERPGEARKIFARGIELAARQADSHTQSELQAALDELGE